MTVSLKPLDQQVVVVTGASSGIGLATALMAAQRGAKVVMAARSAQTLEIIERHIAENGGEALAVPADVSDRQQVEQIARRALERFGRIDTWINNAGISIFGRIDEVSDEDSRRLFETNYWGVVYGSLVALSHLRAAGGALINIGSEASEAVIPLQGMYAASKHAVKGFTDALRVELRADKAPVSVTLIQPTAVNTPFPEHAGSYLSQEPKLPTPMIETERVAEAILGAATKPIRELRVGAMSVINTTLYKLAPRVADQMAKMQIGLQQRDEPSHSRQGALYEGGGSGRMRGRGNENAAGWFRARRSNLRDGTGAPVSSGVSSGSPSAS
jgi:short-subunit dehydrogenase